MKYRRKLKLVAYVSDDSYLVFACLEKFICPSIFWLFEYLFVTNGTGDKVPKKKNKFKFQSLLIDSTDTLDLVILCGQHIKVFNPYISFQYLLVTVWQQRDFVEHVLVTNVTCCL